MYPVVSMNQPETCFLFSCTEFTCLPKSRAFLAQSSPVLPKSRAFLAQGSLVLPKSRAFLAQSSLVLPQKQSISCPELTSCFAQKQSISCPELTCFAQNQSLTCACGGFLIISVLHNNNYYTVWNNQCDSVLQECFNFLP